MRFIDLNDSNTFTLADLKNDWKTLRVEEPENHAASFQIELLGILMATVNGRNDLCIIGMTSKEIERLIHRLQAQL